MSRGSRALCALYTLTSLWHAWCTITTLGHVPLWASALNCAASIVSVMAIVRESVLADERHTVAVLHEREGRRTVWPEPPQPTLDSLVIPDDERARFDEITAGFEDAA